MSQTVTKGSASSLYVNVNGANNRLTNWEYSYDANGNLTSAPFLTMAYDVENRLVEAVHELNGTERYAYDPSNRRVWSYKGIHFYGVNGELLGTYQTWQGAENDYNVYFAGKQIWAEASSGIPAGAVAPDRLGSMVKHFPYGQEPTTTGQNRVKFATYYRDEKTNLDYARNRYYSSTIARFTTPDPYRASGGPADPQSWNRYSYTRGDPINRVDPSGLSDCPPEFGGACYTVASRGTAVRSPSQPSHVSDDDWLYWLYTWGLWLQDYSEYGGGMMEYLAGPPQASLSDLFAASHLTTVALRQTAAEAVANLGPGCKGVFNDPKHKIGTATYYQGLAFNAGTAGYFDAYGDTGSLTLSQTGFVDPVSGKPWAGDPTIATYLGKNIAVAAGGVAVYLSEAFYLSTPAFQAIALVHELMHVTYGGESDADVVARFSIPVPGGYSASQAITAWLQSDCGRLP